MSGHEHPLSAAEPGAVETAAADSGDHRNVFSEFYIDFFGSLIPGIYAVIPAVTVVAISASAYFFAICPQPAKTNDGVIPSLAGQISGWKEVGAGPYGNLGLLLVACYLVGSLCYRSDPKIPDHRSARRIWKRQSPGDRDRLAVQPAPGSRKIRQQDAQFPYNFLYEYLQGRGLEHLAKWVPWQGRAGVMLDNRTKMFINILKIRLQFLTPHRCKEIVRNEGQVRLATSLWYASTLVIVSSFASLLVAAYARTMLSEGSYQTLYGILLLDAAVLALGAFTLRRVESFIHYLRVREIVYVLETADFAARSGLPIHPEDFMSPSCDAASAMTG